MTSSVLPACEQLAEGGEQLRDVVEVQARRRLVEDVRACRSPTCDDRCAAILIRCASPPDSVVAGWPEAEVAEADLVEHLQAAQHLGRVRRRR